MPDVSWCIKGGSRGYVTTRPLEWWIGKYEIVVRICSSHKTETVVAYNQNIVVIKILILFFDISTRFILFLH